MDVRLPMMIQDPMVALVKDIAQPTEGFISSHEDFFLDGPVTARVAVLDLNAQSGAIEPGATFKAPAKGRKRGSYVIANEADVLSPDFMQVSVFATVLRTMNMFERKDVLGRRLRWGFEGPQLLVVPRAGEWANAFYERDSRSLQFFFFPANGQTIYTCLSRDIVAHETGHAVLDGIAPDLYHAISPQSLALHEAVADLTAFLLAAESPRLVDAVMRHTGGTIKDSTAFNSIAEQFGEALDPRRKATYLRSLLNDKTLDPTVQTVDEFDIPDLVDRTEPHALSQVLSGALYAVMVNLHTKLTDQFTPESPNRIAASGKALGIGMERFRRLIFRALDYLPPGEVSFADYGRAIIAADQASYPQDAEMREWLTEQFVKRAIVPNEKDLKVKTNFANKAVSALDLDTIVRSEWAAYDFANKNRKLLGIPPKIAFWVLPRLACSKTYYSREGEQTVRECLFKVAWDQTEPSGLGRAFPAQRAVTAGTTLAINWEPPHVIRSLITSDSSQRQVSDRDQLLSRLAQEGLLVDASHADAPDGQPLRFLIPAERLGDVMRVQSTARMLHIAGELDRS